jgi:hypothetical protein
MSAATLLFGGAAPFGCESKISAAISLVSAAILLGRI